MPRVEMATRTFKNIKKEVDVHRLSGTTQGA